MQRLWERGDLLRCLADEATRFPLRLALKAPTSPELAPRFEAVRAWIAGLICVPHIRIEWREVNHRVLGLQRMPQCVWIDDLDSALAMIGKRRDAARFTDLLKLTRSLQPAVLPWLGRRPLRALELSDDWERLLAVVDWLQHHPHPGVYLRQVDIPGIHTKFIEAHRGVLAQWLDLALPSDAINADRSGADQFAARYGFLKGPARIRFRVLDERIALLPGAGVPDIEVDAHGFANLAAPIQHVFVTENETNFLAFPLAARSIVVFGAGYGWESLANADWLRRCSIHYWGDIDTHGFAILDQLRNRFDHVESFLMDRATLMAHELFWGSEPDQLVRDLPRLTNAEHALFDDLRDNRMRPNLRLEQERIGFRRVEAALGERLMRGCDT
ncbi:MAG: Wadjet anti-phage system protein JetD domain-containing protein [Luteimonas sp.]